MTSAPSVVTFGELLLRLDPNGGVRLRQADSFNVRFTGAEANVAVSLANFGVAAKVVSSVPDDELGDACLSFIQRFGVDTTCVVRASGRLGVFYSEPGGVGRAPRIIYDRRHSVFSQTEAASYDWQEILSGHSWLHVAGTAAAVGPAAQSALREGMRTAADLGIGVSLDLNYRSSLWTYAEATRALVPLMEYVSVLTGTGREAIAILDASGSRRPSSPDKLDVDEHIEFAEILREVYGLSIVAGTHRHTRGAGTPVLQGLAVNCEGRFVSREYPILDPVGRIGTGDAYTAGLLHGILHNGPLAETVEFAAAAAYLKQSIQGDVNLVSVMDVERAAADLEADRVDR